MRESASFSGEVQEIVKGLSPHSPINRRARSAIVWINRRAKSAIATDKTSEAGLIFSARISIRDGVVRLRSGCKLVERDQPKITAL